MSWYNLLKMKFIFYNLIASKYTSVWNKKSLWTSSKLSCRYNRYSRFESSFMLFFQVTAILDRLSTYFLLFCSPLSFRGSMLSVFQLISSAKDSSGIVVTLKTGRQEVLGSNPCRACSPSHSEFFVVFSEIRVNTG